METSIYNYSLCIALTLMLWFGFYFLFAKTPNKPIYDNYLRSRRIMGVAVLLLALNYSVHFFFGIRFKNANAAILMNLTTYFICYWLFGSALTVLLDRQYITARRIKTHVALWILFSALSAVVLLWLPEGHVQKTMLWVVAACLVAYGLTLSIRLLLLYKRRVRLFKDTHSDDIGAYIKWLSIFTYWAIVFGVGCGLLTFLPDDYVFVWVLSSIPFYIYLFHCYQSYLLFYEQVEQAMEEDSAIVSEENIHVEELQHKYVYVEDNDNPAYYADIVARVGEWMKADGYLHPGLTINELADMLHTNRTYLSAYINSTYHTNFRDWIAGLRLDYAKRLLVSQPELKIAVIAEKSGFQSASHFIRLFKEDTGCSPAKWRKNKQE